MWGSPKIMIDIKKYKKQIQSLKHLDGGITYRPGKWGKNFKNKKVLDCVAPYIEKHIDRKIIINEFKKYYSQKNADFKTPFLFTMIWGYDSNYGPFRTSEIMRDKSNLDLIKHSLDAMNNNDIEKAFNSLYMIKGLGTSYISKILYFAGKAKNLPNYPLIFDIRVATALVSLSSEGLLDNFLKVFPSSGFKAYNSYNNLIHKWAKDLKVDADQIEFFLFEQKF